MKPRGDIEVRDGMVWLILTDPTSRTVRLKLSAKNARDIGSKLIAAADQITEGPGGKP